MVEFLINSNKAQNIKDRLQKTEDFISISVEQTKCDVIQQLFHRKTLFSKFYLNYNARKNKHIVKALFKKKIQYLILRHDCVSTNATKNETMKQ